MDKTEAQLLKNYLSTDKDDRIVNFIIQEVGVSKRYVTSSLTTDQPAQMQKFIKNLYVELDNSFNQTLAKKLDELQSQL